MASAHFARDTCLNVARNKALACHWFKPPRMAPRDIKVYVRFCGIETCFSRFSGMTRAAASARAAAALAAAAEKRELSLALHPRARRVLRYNNDLSARAQSLLWACSASLATSWRPASRAAPRASAASSLRGSRPSQRPRGGGGSQRRQPQPRGEQASDSRSQQARSSGCRASGGGERRPSGSDSPGSRGRGAARRSSRRREERAPPGGGGGAGLHQRACNDTRRSSRGGWEALPSGRGQRRRQRGGRRQQPLRRFQAHPPLVLMLVGVPGSGKSTQAKVTGVLRAGKPPEGCEKTRARLALGAERDGRHKARCAAGGRLAGAPAESACSGAAPPRGPRVVAFPPELSGPEPRAAGVGRACLCAKASELLLLLLALSLESLRGARS